MATISKPALRRLQTLYNAFANHSFDVSASREDRLRWAATVLGRPVSSFGTVSASDGKTLIDSLQQAIGQNETAAPRPRMGKRDAQKLGTEGRKDQLHADITLVDGTEPIFAEIYREMTALGWKDDRMDRLRSFLRSTTGPLGGRAEIRTLGDANKVHWALKGMAERLQKGAAA